MYLHRLTLCAIGPYADEFSIDFAALGASGLFLLEGPTGSGKSTIIDAIVFGLYGTLAGEASSNDRLHSHHAPPRLEPFVELVFETAAGIHRIRRTPQWFRPKSRGIGVTKANASVTLVRLTSPDATDGESVSSNTAEAGAEITRIIGLTRQQFVQTVVLPQGEFARFLSATGEERRLVLQSLFGTKIYDATTEVLASMRRSVHAQVAAAEQAVAEALASLRGAASDDELTLDGASAVVAGFTQTASDSARARDEARQLRDAAEQARLEAVRLGDALARRGELLARRATLAEAAPAVDEARRRLELGRRATAIAAPRRAHEAAVEAVTTAAVAVRQGEGQDPELAALDLDTLVARRDALVAEVATLTAIAVLEATLGERAADLERSATARDEALLALGRDEAALEARPAARVAVIDTLTAATEAVGGLDRAERSVEEALAGLALVAERDELAGAVAAVSAQVDASAAAAHAALDAETGLRRRRIHGMAGELALALVDGEACSVCGSTSHPMPARLTDEHPSDGDIELAAEARAAAELILQQHRDAASSLRARHDEAVRRSGGDTDESAEARLVAARAAASAAGEAAAAAAAARAAVEAFDAETAELASAVHEARVILAGSGARIDADRAALADDRARVAAALDGRGETCAALLGVLEREQSAVARLVSARLQHERALGDEARRAAELTEALVSSGFESLEASSDAALPPSDLAGVESEIRRHDSDVAVVAEGLASPRIAELTGDERVDVDAATTLASEADARLSTLAADASLAADRSDRAARALSALETAVRASDDVAEESRAIVRMADVTGANSPDNLVGITLGTYVLLRRFDDVVAAANARLATMSSGRYALEASESRESGSRSRKTGLALAIRDNATDTTRDPKSFSGGETFYASLSLALGLADVVQAEAGGIDLGTLFVDEGFGTLDPEALDSVMSELGRLSAEGRVVGIVSHVDELKQRIADRIEVRRRPDGSSTVSSTAG